MYAVRIAVESPHILARCIATADLYACFEKGKKKKKAMTFVVEQRKNHSHLFASIGVLPFATLSANTLVGSSCNQLSPPIANAVPTHMQRRSNFIINKKLYFNKPRQKLQQF